MSCFLINSRSNFIETLPAISDRSWKAQIVGRPIQSDPGSDECISMIRDWIQECNNSHPRCHQHTSRNLPARLIDVGSADELSEPRLVNSDGRQGYYVALTHVWGGLVPVRTLKENIAKFMCQIPFLLLPTNFKDAITITRRLGIQYLWIDALCIIQDSIRDWEAECAKMGDTYRNSVLTIAAVDAESSKIGFLKRRPPSVSNPPSCQLPCQASWGCEDVQVKAVQRDPLGDLDENTPLVSRAWCMQEKLLSSRMLYFGAKQTYWDCNTTSHFEAYGSAPLPGYTVQSGLYYGKVNYTQSMDKLRAEMRYSHYGVWIRVVNEYSSRNLSKLEDKLPALSGLASDFHEITGFTYLAGIWKEDIHQGLTWAIDKPQHQLPEKPYIAPSWSWASHVGGVSFTSPIGEMDARIQDTGISLAGLDPFGRVTSGFLRLCGRAKKAVVKYQETSEIPSFTYIDHRQSLYDTETGQEIGRCSFDYAGSAVSETFAGITPFFENIGKSEKIVVCFALTRHAMDSGFRSSVMILESVKSTAMSTANEWRRIGMACVQYPKSVEGLRGQDWFANVQDQELVIV